MLCGVPYEEIDLIWPLVAPFIEIGCKRPGMTLGALDVRTACKSKHMQLWMFWSDDHCKTVAVTEIVTHPLTTFANIVLSEGGEWTDWHNCLPQIEEWARDNSCTKMRFLARPGLEKVLPDYTKTQVVLEKEI